MEMYFFYIVVCCIVGFSTCEQFLLGKTQEDGILQGPVEPLYQVTTKQQQTNGCDCLAPFPISTLTTVMVF